MTTANTVNYMAENHEKNAGTPFFFVRSADQLASMVVQAQKLGVIDGWREYIMDQAKRSGISNQELKAAIDKLKRKPA